MKLPAINQQDLFPPDLKQAGVIQTRLAESVIQTDDFGDINIIAGVDVSNSPWDPEGLVYAAIAVLDGRTLQLIEQAGAVAKPPFPYVPGFLGFREVPVVLEALQKLKHQPDLFLVDGHGISHPRGLGIASHLGVVINQPTIGVAKSILVGAPVHPVGPIPFDQAPLHWRGCQLATMLRTRRRANPLIISTGHRISLDSAVSQVISCARGYRLPEPTRQAHLTANLFRTRHQL